VSLLGSVSRGASRT